MDVADGKSLGYTVVTVVSGRTTYGRVGIATSGTISRVDATDVADASGTTHVAVAVVSGNLLGFGEGKRIEMQLFKMKSAETAVSNAYAPHSRQ